MNSTMPKSGQAPTSPNAMPGGLGAILQQPGGAPKGMPARGVQQMIDTAKSLSDRQLADVLEGKSLDVPQYVAMTEAMGRKSLRTAMQGVQAQQQKKPSLKDMYLAEEAAAEMSQGMPMAPQQPVMAAGGGLMYAGGGAIDMNESADNSGLAMLPAPNMMPMSMAGGGIVAFQNNEDQPVREGMPGTDLTEEEKKELAENAYMQRVQGVRNVGNAFFTPRNYDPIAKLSDLASSVKNWGQNTDAANASWNASSKMRTGENKSFTGEQTPKGKLVEAGLVDRNTPIQDVAKVAASNEQKRTALNAVDREEAAAGAGMTALLNAQQRQAAPKDSGVERRKELAGNAGVGVNPSTRANPFGQLKIDLPDYERAKNQGLGEGLMALSGALFGNPDMSRALAQGMPILSKISGATRKELSELKKEYNSQQLNLAKANELYEQGQEDKAFKYYKQSQDNAYHMTTAMAAMANANKPSGSLDLVNLIRKENPNMSVLDAVAAAAGAKNEPKSDQAMRDAYIKSPYLQAMYPNIEEYLKKMNPAGATMASNTGFSAVYGPDNKRIQ